MFKTLFIIIYCLLTAYIYWRVARFVHHKYLIIRLLAVGILCLSLLSTMLWAEILPFQVNVWAHQISHFWLFSFAYTIPIALGFHIFSLFGKRKPALPYRYILCGMLLLGTGLLWWGYWQYKKIEVVELEIPVENWEANHTPITVLFASDLHFGYTITRTRAKEMVEAMLAQKADLILLGGDIIDRSVLPVRQQKIEAELSRLQARYGVYSVLGNHEGYKDAPANRRFLQECGIQLLIDTAVQIPGVINLIGRIEIGKQNNQRAALLDTLHPDDFRKPLATLQAMLPPEQQPHAPKKLPTILLDHVPRIPSAEQLEGIDLMLSGHTHNGQIFPFNLILKRTNELSYGAARKGNALLYVTSGLGLWGARFRLGTQTEIVKIRFVPVQGKKAQLLFTSDMHSQLCPVRSTGRGGFARISTALENEKKAFSGPTVVVDAGDFLMGSKYHTLFPSGPVEPGLMSAMGYDAITLGNHEFDFTAGGLANALTKISDTSFRKILIIPNLRLSGAQQKAWPILAAPNTKLIKKCIAPQDTLRIGIFGILGKKAIADAPTAGISFSDPFEHARACVRELQLQKADLIVALAHNGTAEHNPENDYALAKQVPGIDIIVSGHTHAVRPQEWRYPPAGRSDRGTVLVSAGSQGAFLGKLIMGQVKACVTKRGADTPQWKPLYHRLIPMDTTLAENTAMAYKITKLNAQIDEIYFSRFGYRANTLLATSALRFPNLDELQGHFGDNAVAQLITDAFAHAAQKYSSTLPGEPSAGKTDPNIPTVGVLGMGNLRATLPTGAIRAEDIFNLLSFGSGPDGLAGFPLICVYLNRSELLTLCEMDANFGGKYNDFQLQFSGLKYAANPHRPLFNKVYRLDVPQSKWYRVVTNLYAAQRLAEVENLSYGILKIAPKDAGGQPVSRMQTRILRNPKGAEIKEWVAVADYLQSLGSSSTTAHAQSIHFPERYAQPEIRKDLHPPGIKWTLLTLFGHYNLPGGLQVVFLFVVIGIFVYVCIRWIQRIAKPNKK